VRKGVGRSLPATLCLLSSACVVLLAAPHASAQAPDDREALIATLEGASLEDLLATPGFLSLTQHGGAGLVVTTGTSDGSFESPGPMPTGVRSLDLGDVSAGDHVAADALSAAVDTLASALDGSDASEETVLLVSGSPGTAAEASGDGLGAVVIASGSPGALAAALRAAPTDDPVDTVTSDSTRRDGVVIDDDVVYTAAAFVDPTTDVDGELIRIVDGPPPLDLHDRYVQSKRLTVPIGTAAAVYVGLASLIAIIALWRPDVSQRHRRFCASLAISVPFVALSLLLVGHLPSLTYATVIPFVAATTAIATLALVPAARRWGTLGAIAAAGVILLAALAIEGVLGWPAALTPLLGGSQLDGGRFFGLPNAFIGLLMGGSLYVAQRLPRTSGTVLIAAAGLFAGSPWTGSNIGAAVTLFAAAGIWWGLRGGLVWWRTAIAAVAAIAAGTVLVVVAHRYLTSAATHITTFSEHTGGIAGLWDRFVDRLGVGFDLIADNPFALLPVIGVLVMLGVVLRPPAPIRRSFDAEPVWRLALLTIVVGSVVAYLVNDSGAAAVGEGLTTSLAGMLYVSLRLRDDMMTS
jgi:hypothetical protein